MNFSVFFSVFSVKSIFYTERTEKIKNSVFGGEKPVIFSVCPVISVVKAFCSRDTGLVQIFSQRGRER